VNYPTLPRSGLPGPRLLRSGLPGSVSELASDVDTAAPDSAGGFPSRAVRSVPLLPIRHSATTGGARFLSRLNAVGRVASILLPSSTAGVVNVAENVFANRAGAVSPPYSAPSGRSVEEGGVAPSPQKLTALATLAFPGLPICWYPTYVDSCRWGLLKDMIEANDPFDVTDRRSLQFGGSRDGVDRRDPGYWVRKQNRDTDRGASADSIAAAGRGSGRSCGVGA